MTRKSFDEQALDMVFAVGRVLSLIGKHGSTDGEHHKQWLLDQIVRGLHLNDEELYKDWVARFCAGEDGPNTYEWDTGIAP